MKFIYIYILFVLTVALAFCASAQQQRDNSPKWELTENVPPNVPKISDQNPPVTVHDMYIYIELEQATPVKLFTILGQPVSQMQLQPGTSRLRVPARGIYILKIGDSTRRITI